MPLHYTQAIYMKKAPSSMIKAIETKALSLSNKVPCYVSPSASQILGNNILF